MSYQVIARKWRSQTFDELVGQRHVTQTLVNALKSGRLAHALLLTGPRGTGKTSTARILAKSLRCPQAKDFVPCNQCSECADINSGRSINVIEIDGASNNGVDAIRELRDTVSYMPSSGQFKLYIIDEVHMLSTSAFNALLKTLEEPPAHVIFVLATTEVQKIPQTILSRCQRLDFRRIPSRDIVEHLSLICKQENVKAETDALWMIARQAEGSMRDSQSLLDQVITYSEGQITRDKTIEVLGLTNRTLLLDALEAFVHRERKAVLDVVERLTQSGFDPKVFAQELLEELRHFLLVKISSVESAKLIDLPDTEIQQLKKLADHLSEEDIHLLFDMALKGNVDMIRAQDPRIVLEMILLRMSSAPRIEGLASRAPAITPAVKKTVSEMPKPAQASSSEPASTVGTLEQRWFQFVKQVNGLNPLLGAKLAHATPIAVEPKEKIVVSAIPANMRFLVEQLSESQVRKTLNELASQFWERGYRIELKISEAQVQALSPKALEDKQKLEKQKSIQEQVEKHPLIQSVNKVFKTEIKSIKERQ